MRRWFDWLRRKPREAEGGDVNALPKVLATSEDATRVLAVLFREHGTPVTLEEGWVVSAACGFKAQARVFTHCGRPPQAAIQLDVEVITSRGKHILESVAGVGADMHHAILNGVRAFSEGSFHVIYSALTGQSCSHCQLETWSIGGVERRVFLGPITMRMSQPDDPSSIDWFSAVEPHVKALVLDSSMHWVRFYHWEINNGSATNEALLDNTPAPDLVAVLASFPWPKAGSLYSVRVFLIIADVE